MAISLTEKPKFNSFDKFFLDSLGELDLNKHKKFKGEYKKLYDKIFAKLQERSKYSKGEKVAPIVLFAFFKTKMKSNNY